MDIKLLFEIIFNVIGGLGIFLIGMKNMSEGMQTVAGNKIRKMINAVTNNRVMGCGVGTTITSIVQSSSVTTVMVVGMVNAGLMTLIQAISVIMGANIGTTITAWIIGLPIGKWGLPILGFSALFFLFSKNDKLKFWATFFVGLGMVFFGLELMSGGFKPLRSLPEFSQWFHAFSPSYLDAEGISHISYFGVWKCVLVGAILTAIVQSSSATIGITMALGIQGTIDYPTAAALIMGENIGTTITAILASIGAGTNARRASLAHVFINIFGVLWITSIFSMYISVVTDICNWFIGGDCLAAVTDDAGISYPGLAKLIPATHSGFNIINTIILLPFTTMLAKFLTRIVPDKKVAEVPHLTYIDVRMLETPAIAIEQCHKEIVHMARMNERMLNLLKEEVVDNNTGKAGLRDKIFNKENILDNIQKEVVEFISKSLTGNVSQELADDAREHIRLADEYESISDYVTAILKLHIKLENNELELHEEGKKALTELHVLVADYLTMINDAVSEEVGDILTRAQTKGASITHKIKQFRSEHLDRVSSGQTSPFHSLVFTDILNSYRKIKDHALNIAETIAGEK